jgi:hypothetical protein
VNSLLIIQPKTSPTQANKLTTFVNPSAPLSSQLAEPITVIQPTSYYSKNSNSSNDLGQLEVVVPKRGSYTYKLSDLSSDENAITSIKLKNGDDLPSWVIYNSDLKIITVNNTNSNPGKTDVEVILGNKHFDIVISLK